MKYAFVVNPNSGRRKGDALKLVIEAFCDERKWDYEIFRWDDPDSLYPTMEYIMESGFDVVAAAGGDGTIHLVAQHLIGTDVALAVLPIGTGNAFANHFGIEHDPDEALKLLEKPNIISIDVAEVNGTPFLSFFGFGLDARVAHRYTKVKNRNLFSYMFISIKFFLNHKPERCIVHYQDIEGDHQEEWVATVVTAANIAEFGLKAKVAPGASTLDGKIDLAGLFKPRWWHLPEFLIRLYGGTLPNWKQYKRVKSDKFSITREKPDIAQVDGEPFFTSERIEIKVLPKSLKIVIPKSESSNW